jgi:periplasmic mercuric ion binding protein
MKNLSHIVLFVCFSLMSVSGVRAASIRATVATPNQTVTLNVQHMDCALCPFTVRKALQNVPGVIKVSVDFHAKTATVIFDPAKTSAQALTLATGNAGFPSTVKQQAS